MVAAPEQNLLIDSTLIAEDAVNVDVKTDVSSAKVVAAAEKLVPILQATVAKLQVIAEDPESFVVDDETLGPIVGTVVEVRCFYPTCMSAKLCCSDRYSRPCYGRGGC